MKSLFFVVLAGSLLANAWLWQRRTAPPGEAKVEARRERSGPPPQAATLAPAVKQAAEATANALENADVGTLRAALLAAGADEAIVRALVSGVLRRRYETQTSAWRIERLRTTWWRGTNAANNQAGAPSGRALVSEPLVAFLGLDPLDLADAERRYDFLPPEKRRLLALIDLDYLDLQARQNRAGSTTKAEEESSNLLVRERRKDIEAALTAEERAEYDLRAGPFARDYARRFALMDGTEQEFRAVAPIVTAFKEEAKMVLSDPNGRSVLPQIEQRALDQLVAALGYERALEFSWATSYGGYVPTYRFMQEMNLPGARAAQVMELAAETGVKGTAIHRDETLTVAQKQAALAALQATVRPQFDALVPPPAQEKLPPEAIAWFRALGDGRYVPHRPAGMSTGSFGASPVSVTTPLRYPAQPIALPRRIGN